MKKVLLFLIAVGFFIGAFITIKNNALKSKENNEVIKEIENETYIDELNLPLIEVDTMNPLFTKNKQVCDILKLIYEPLFDFDETNKIVPKLASEWLERDDNTWLIKLNDNAIWHDGKDFSAEDIIFTYDSIKSSETSVYKENLKNIESIEKIDNNTIQINLLSNDDLIFYKLTFPIIPKHYFTNDLYNELNVVRLCGTGPYRYTSITDDEKVISLTSNESWWKKESFKLNKIYLHKYATYGEAIKAFKSTEIDVISTTMSSWQKKFGAIGINSYMFESSEYETIIANTQKNILNESSVRRMILSIINSENIVESIYNGNGKVSSYPNVSTSYLNFTKENRNHDIEKAKQLLINAGWNNLSGLWKKQINGKLYVLEFDLLVDSENEQKIEIANMIVENLKEIGIKTNIIKVKTSEYHKRIEKGNFELALATLNLDMDTDVIELVESNSIKNFARYNNFEIDNIIAQINKENLDQSYMKIQEIYKNECPYIGMYYKCNNLLTNKSVKGNINPTSWNVYHGITGWCK